MAVCKNILCKGLQSRKLYVYLPLPRNAMSYRQAQNIQRTAYNLAGFPSDRSTSVSLRFLAEIQRRLAFFVYFQIVYQKNAKKRKQFDSRRTRCVRFNAYGAKDRIHASSGATNQTLLSGIAFGRSESLRHCEFAFDSSISCGFPRRGDQYGLQSPKKQISKTCNLDREYCLLSDKPGRFIVFPGNIRFRSMCVAFVA